MRVFFFWPRFLAAAMAVFALRRWLELRKAYKKLAQSDEKLRFQAMLLDRNKKTVLRLPTSKGKNNLCKSNTLHLDKKKSRRAYRQSIRVYDRTNSLSAVQSEIIKTTLEKGRWLGEITNTDADGNKIVVDSQYLADER